jgi:N-acetyl-anhydromuramyl-L-alanine amidase AmpD
MYKENRLNGNYTKGRVIKPKGIILHHTGDYSEKSICNHFTNPESKASAHVVIWKDGNRTIFVEDDLKAWHAGVSEFMGNHNCNNFMLGVEFHGDTNKEPLTYNQIDSFIEWSALRIVRWRIKKEWVTDHRTVAPDRKVDLNPKELSRVLTAIKYFWL